MITSGASENSVQEPSAPACFERVAIQPEGDRALESSTGSHGRMAAWPHGRMVPERGKAVQTRDGSGTGANTNKPQWEMAEQTGLEPAAGERIIR
ncbi:MAG TPA: hypothetical protein VG994_11500 [Steroidobacteraceae bacterium]|nr:hypothetical protein [Steroidobacteraceae bacterium]